MNFSEKRARINHICYEGRNHFMYYDVLFHKKKKLLFGASFDNIYYYEFFILFTGVRKDAASLELKADECTFRSLHIEDGGIGQGGLYVSRLKTNWEGADIELHHRDLFYYAPEKPLYTGAGVRDEDRARYPGMDLTRIVDRCLALEDSLKI